MASATPTGRTPADLGEFGLISAIVDRLRRPEVERDVILGPGDDAAIVRAPDARMVVSTDLLVDTRHFRRDWATADDIGHKAAAQNLSDINAMGGTASALTLGLVLPADIDVDWLLELVGGFADEAASVGASVVGGDVTRGNDLCLAVTVLGSVDGEPVRRSGARPGDVVALCGRQGWAAAGLAVLGRGFRSPRAVVDAHRRPAPPYAAGPEAQRLGATSLIDVSDGLLSDLAHVARASAVTIDVRSGAFVIDEPLQAVAAATGADPLDFILGGGDDHPLVGTFPGDLSLPESWTVIGTVGARHDDSPGVTVDGAAYAGSPGHAHF